VFGGKEKGNAVVGLFPAFGAAPISVVSRINLLGATYCPEYPQSCTLTSILLDVLDGVMFAESPMSTNEVEVNVEMSLLTPCTTCNTVPLGRPADVTALRD